MSTPLIEELAKAIRAELEILKALYEAIRDSGGIPSGHLYATVMGEMDLDKYTKRIDRLKSLDLITESPYHYLRIKEGK